MSKLGGLGGEGGDGEEETDAAQNNVSLIPAHSGPPWVNLCNGLPPPTAAEIKQGGERRETSSPSSLSPGRPRGPQCSRRRQGTEIRSLSLLPSLGESGGTWVCVHGSHVFTRACVVCAGWVAVVSGLLSAALSGSCGSEPTELAASHQPSRHQEKSPEAPCAGPSPAPNRGRQVTPGGGRRVPNQGQSRRAVCTLGPQALATASDTPWAVSSASTLSR